MNIRVDLNTPIKDGTEVVFRSPVDCSQITGLIVYYNGESKEFALADAHGNNVGDIDHLFAENVVVKVILDVTTSMAFVQNADTNAYLEWRFKDTIDKCCPPFTVTGTLVRCEPVKDYPLNITVEDGATTISRCGKNLIDYTQAAPRNDTQVVNIIENGVEWAVGNHYFAIPCDIKAGDVVVFSCVDDADAINGILLYDSKTKTECSALTGKGKATTAKADADIARVYKRDPTVQITTPVVITNLQLEYGTAATAYEPFKGIETFPVGETVLGVSGVNTIWADNGEITVTGRADPVAIIEKLTNAIISLGGNI